MDQIWEFVKPMLKVDVWTALFIIAFVCYVLGRLIKGNDVFEKIYAAIMDFITRFKGKFKQKDKDNDA